METGTRGRKAQLKMAETIFVLIIFFFLLGFGIIFYAQMKQGQLKEMAEEAGMLQAIRNIQNIQHLPELQCTDSSNINYDCIDLYKVKAFSTIMAENSRSYESIFGNTRVDIVWLYPSPGNATIYKKDVKHSKGTAFHVPINIYDATDRSKSFGYMNITVYS